MSRYRLTPEAEADLDEIKRYCVKAGGPRLARYILNEIRAAVRFLAANPGAGHARTDLTDQPMKFWSVFSYMIVYDPASRPIAFARIVQGRQDLVGLFRQRPPKPN